MYTLAPHGWLVLVGALWDMVAELWWYGWSPTCFGVVAVAVVGLGVVVHASFVVVDEEEGVWEWVWERSQMINVAVRAPNIWVIYIQKWQEGLWLVG